MERLLITGASGFIGKAITAEAAKTGLWEVIAVTSGRRRIQFPENIRVVSADLRDLTQCKKLIREQKPDVMIHLAWNLEGRDFLNANANIDWLQTSYALLKAFKEIGGRKSVFSGSSAEYGYENEVCSEDDLCKPSDMYGRCKLAFSNTALPYCLNNNIEFVDARLFSVYGVGERHVLHIIPSVIDALIKGEKFICKGPNNEWDYVFVNDVAEAVTKILTTEYCGAVNIARTKPVRIKDMVLKIADLIGRRELVVFENEDLPGKKLIGDSSLLNKNIGYCCQTEIDSGLEQTVKWWIDKREKGVL